MQKILLVTMQDNYNIGNRLQNYALTTVLEKFGAEVTNLDNGYTVLPDHKTILKNRIKKLLGKLGSRKYAEKYQSFYNSQFRRKANFDFTARYLPRMIKTTCEDAFRQNWGDFNLAIVGSDQVWHRWGNDPKELPYYYLEFMPKEKRVSYAASFGFEEFPEVDKAEHIKGLNGMHVISCREKSGCKLIKRETGRDALHVLDPTLLLTADDWRKVAAPIPEDLHVENGKYAFIYFLGQIPDEYQKFIDETLKKRGIKAVDFLDFKNESIAKCGVGEFLSLIDNADYVLTDSFHCTVFSILFNKEFTVFKRKGEGFEKMFGRIEELLNITGHQSNAYEDMYRIDNEVTFKDLQKTSFEYLEKVLNKLN